MFTLIIQPRLPSPIHLNWACSRALTGRPYLLSVYQLPATSKIIIFATFFFLFPQEIPAHENIRPTLLFPLFLDKFISDMNTH